MRFLFLLSAVFFLIHSNCIAVLYDSQDVIKQFELRTTPNYVVLGKENNQESFFNESQSLMTEENLGALKEKIHHGAYRTNQYPNVCEGSVTIFFKNGEKYFKNDFRINGKFISGGHFFDKKDLDFKNDHSFVTSFDLIEDLYSKKEAKYLQKVEKERGIELGKDLEDKIDECISGGAWRHNCSHSEALFFLKLKQKLKNFFKSLNYPITIVGCVVNISSYFDPCYQCMCLSQGFQWNLKYFLTQLKNPFLDISDNFGTLCFVYGQKESLYPISYGKGFYGSAEPVILEPGQHKFVQVMLPKRLESQSDDSLNVVPASY